MIAARAYQTLALVLHEMMTNAAKYGALSIAGGTLDITWSLDEDLTIAWSEAGGPPVTPPTRRGFGTVVTEQSIAFELHGTAAIEYHEDGVQARFTIPAALVHAAAEEEDIASDRPDVHGRPQRQEPAVGRGQHDDRP